MPRDTALFIGHTYIDLTISTDVIPSGDDKAIAHDYDFGIGGNATVAAITNQKVGIKTELLTPIASDLLGQVVCQKYESYGIKVHERDVKKTSLSLVLPNNGKRAILRCRDSDYAPAYPNIPLENIKALHLDGHQPEAAIEYAKKCRSLGIITSLDGGGLRSNTYELLKFIDVAVVSMRFCEQINKTPAETINWLIEEYKTPVAAVTMGEEGMLYALNGGKQEHMPALPVPSNKVLDTTGAGDIFHGAYIASYMMNSNKPWPEHFAFARAASSISIQRLGTESSIPTLKEIQELLKV